MKAGPTLDPQILRDVEASCICLRVQRASRAVGRRYDDAFRHLALTNWQFSLLAAVEAEEAQSVNELATFLGMDRTTMTRNLAVLQRRGLLLMAPDARDGRVRRVSLTPEGSGLLRKALDAWRATNDAVKASISAVAFSAMWQGLDELSRP